MVYAGGRKFDNVTDLQEAIIEAWNGMDLAYLWSLYRSIPSKLGSMLEIVAV